MTTIRIAAAAAIVGVPWNQLRGLATKHGLGDHVFQRKNDDGSKSWFMGEDAAHQLADLVAEAAAPPHDPVAQEQVDQGHLVPVHSVAERLGVPGPDAIARLEDAGAVLRMASLRGGRQLVVTKTEARGV